ncbi:DUF6153 family protein [Streptomyces sp. NPDC015220]|uniref:DUF6153 family protein n=1 Tax=Streptomyces sp. NPDC015220 TaxID=3364947 RepID=UPI0036FE186C
MTSGARTRSAAKGARWTLLVLAVLAGVLAMHALSPGGMPSSGEHGAMTPLAMAEGHAGTATQRSVPAHRDMPSAHRDMPSAHRAASARQAPASPDRAAPPSPAASTGHRGAPAHRVAPAHRADGVCRHLAGADSGGTAMSHTGGTCAAAGTATAYVPPALLPAPDLPAPAPTAARTGAATGNVDGRAPPDLAELQLLRI